MGNKQFYTNDSIKYLLNKNIFEYDIKRAGVTMLYEINYFDKDTYNSLINMHKLELDIALGKYLNPATFKLINENIAIKMNEFITANNISKDNIISLKKDALFIYNINPHIVTFGKKVEFVRKNIYTSFFKLGDLELYFNSNTGNIDIKGVSSDSSYKLHPLIYVVKDICKRLEHLELGLVSYNDVFSFIQKVNDEYLDGRMVKDTYRELNATLKFRSSFNSNVVYFDNLPDLDSFKLDVSYNWKTFIAPFVSLLSTIDPYRG